jgi:glyoxylase-like metal-dependent hydrolase (beta-lactamase superfamily II)
MLKFCFALLLCVQAAVADDDFSKEIVKATALSASVYMLEGAGGNMTAWIGPRETVLVDDDFAPMASKLLDKLKELGGSSPRWIMNTHFHYDHSGGNRVFGPSATIVSTPEVRQRLMSEQTLWKEQHPAEPPQAWPSVTYENSLTLQLAGEEVQLVHYPHAHTDGDTVVFFKNAKVVSMGDIYFSGMYPIFHPEHAGSLSGYLRAIESVLRKISDDTKIVPGHGPLSSKKELAAYHQMILASVAAVKTGIRRGLSLEQIQKAGLPKEWQSFSHGYLTTEQWLALVYQNVK